MKHPEIFRTAGIAMALLASSESFAQPAQFTTSKPEVRINIASSIADAADEIDVLENLKGTNERLYRSYTRKFEGASDIHVNPFKRNTVLYCKVDGIQINILFTNKGAWLHTVRYYSPDLLPPEVRCIVKHEFPEFKMQVVAEVSTPTGTAYLVNIETKAKFKTIRVVNHEWDVYQEFNKN